MRRIRRNAVVTVSAPTVLAVADLIDPDDLVGASEIAERLGLASTSVIRDWRRRHPDFPQPILTLRLGSLWSWRAVDAWARSTGRLGGPSQ